MRHTPAADGRVCEIAGLTAVAGAGRLRRMGDAGADEMFRVAAQAYDRHVGRYSRELAAALVAIAGVQPGQDALDVGCGPGGLTSELVALLGAEHVAAIDPSQPFADACRRRLPGVRVEVGPAERLPFADATFDRTLSQLVINFMTDAPAGLREMLRVTVPGGTIAAAVWDYRGEMTFLRRFWDAAVALDPSASDEGRSMPYCTPDELAELFSAAGLADVEVAAVVVSAGYESFEDLWEPLERGVGPSGAHVVSLDGDGRAALRGELRRRLEVGEGPFELSARAFVASGRVG
jgi:ubiquinone/menaquinone biosynthesis C-methylase UbiE